jgi:magnesium-transporting ATPase (P-type)
VYSGSLVVRGHGRAEVTATGARSEIGKIGLAITRIDTEPSRLLIQTRRLVRNLAALSLSLSALAVFLYGFWRGGWLDALLSGIALGKCQLVPKSIQTIHSSTRKQCYHKKAPPHRRRPVPIAEMGPGLRREVKGGDAALNHLNASEH